MGTTFDYIYNKFYIKIVESEDFYMYQNVTDVEVEALIKEKAFDYMTESIATILEYSSPDVDFNDYDESLETFGFEMTKSEIQMLTNLMVEKHISRDLLKIKIYNKHFTTSEINLFSQANERKTFVDMLKNIQKKNIRAIRAYDSRDRLTNALKSYSGGDLWT